METTAEWQFRRAALLPDGASHGVWHGEKDILVPVAVGRYLADAIPGAESTILPAEGHLLIVDHFEEILRTLVAASEPEAARVLR